MADIENTVFPSFELDEGLRIVSKNFTSSRAYSSVRVGKSIELLTDGEGMRVLNSLLNGESGAIKCFCPSPVGAVVYRRLDGWTVRLNSVTAALVERVKSMQSLSAELSRGMNELCMMSCVSPEIMPRLRRAVFMQQRVNEFIERALLPLPDRFCRLDLTRAAEYCASAASEALSGTGLGVICTGDVAPAMVFVSRKDISYMFLSLAAFAFSLTDGRLVEVKFSRTKSHVTADVLFSVSPRGAAGLADLAGAENPVSQRSGPGEGEMQFLALYTRLMCELNGGEMKTSSCGGTGRVTLTFPLCRDDTVTLTSHPLLAAELKESASALLGCYSGR